METNYNIIEKLIQYGRHFYVYREHKGDRSEDRNKGLKN